MAKKGSKNNIANRGAKAKLRVYGGKPVKEVKIVDKKNGQTFMGAQYDNGDVVVAPDGSFVKFASIQERQDS